MNAISNHHIPKKYAMKKSKNHHFRDNIAKE